MRLVTPLDVQIAEVSVLQWCFQLPNYIAVFYQIWYESLSGALYNIDHPILGSGFDAWIALLIHRQIVGQAADVLHIKH